MGKILVVDDSQFISNTMHSAISELGHEVIMANNGQEGLKIMRDQKVDLVFSDYNMPIMRGLEMVREMKKDENLKFIPIVMLTTENSDDKKSEGKELGVQAWMVKPFKKEKIQMAIKKLLG